MIWCISFRSFSEVIRDFHVTSAIGNLCIICLIVSVLIPAPCFCFLFDYFEEVDDFSLEPLSAIVFNNFRKISFSKILSTFSLKLKRHPKFLKTFFFVFYHILSFFFLCKIYFVLQEYHLLITFFHFFLLKNTTCNDRLLKL